MSKVLILGATGMLGSAVLEEFTEFNGSVFKTSRRGENPDFIDFDAARDSIDDLLGELEFSDEDFIVNCIGIIKPYIKDDNENQRLTALKVNSLFPHQLATAATSRKVKVIQIATDCAFSGNKGEYVESDLHDATDVYGKTKSLGEVPNPWMMHLRVSIIGPEVGRSTSLLEWVKNQPVSAEISGYTDHMWNGIPTRHYGRICKGIIEGKLFKAGTFHILPNNQVSKFELVSLIAAKYDRLDIKINPVPSGKVIDRTLKTIYPEINKEFWTHAGYKEVPNMDQLIREI